VGNATEKYESRNPVTRRLLARFLAEIDAAVQEVAPAGILDVGCGEGVISERLAGLTGAPTLGVDLGDPLLQAEWRQREGGVLSFEAASAYDLPFDDRSFDCVCAIEVLEHLERPGDALAEIKRVAGGAILLSVPREPLWRIAHLLAGRDVRSLGNTPGHINHWSARSFRRFVSGFGSVVRIRHPFPWTVILLEPWRT
jgi:2-polyprenyl-3-methyl-5-hydroxy-6-metoxy-1,4-benzoquinol methylase